MKSFYERQARENEEDKRRALEGYNDRHWELFKQAIADRNLFRDVAKDELSELENDVYSKSSEKNDELSHLLNGGLSQAKNIVDLTARREYAYRRDTENKF